ncbi:MAG: hypothetical protein ACPGYY_06130 [Bacteroidia bacterium]
MSQFTKGQNVFTTFPDTLVYDDFSSESTSFTQKYNTYELSTIEKGLYRLKRLSGENQSISYFKYSEPFYSYEISTTLEIVKSKPSPSGGLVLHGQSTVVGGLFIEFNNERHFRAYKLTSLGTRLLSGSAETDGWIKTKCLNKRGKNKITAKVKDGYVDLYFNDDYTYTIFDVEFDNGKIGILANANSEIMAHDFLILKEKSLIDKVVKGDDDNADQNEGDPAFQEVILIFKTKIDQQQKEITTLQSELDQCKSMLNYDTTLVNRAQELEASNKSLSHRLDSTTKMLEVNKKRLEYLESMKEDIENGSNGDLVLSLTEILTGIKKENKSLKKSSQAKTIENAQLKKDNAVLLREIERLKYLLKQQE